MFFKRVFERRLQSYFSRLMACLNGQFPPVDMQFLSQDVSDYESYAQLPGSDTPISLIYDVPI